MPAYFRSMRLLLPFILLIFGALLALLLIQIAVFMANSGAPDATAVSTDRWTMINGGIGAVLMIVGLVQFIIRIVRPMPARTL